MTSEIQQRLADVQAEIAAACQAAGRSPDEVTLVAVSKTHPAEEVVTAFEAGQVDFGENRPEEAVEKIAQLKTLQPDAGLRWHMIGHVQSRKARLVVGRFVLVHSLDSMKLAEKLSRLAQEEALTLDMLLEINISGEQSKYGFEATKWKNSRSVRESLWDDIQSMLNMPGIRLRGLMTMAPIVEDQELARPVFAGLRELRDTLRQEFPQSQWDVLSMGMTDDFGVAIEEGATLVRIGRAIFGPRMVR